MAAVLNRANDILSGVQQRVDLAVANIKNGEIPEHMTPQQKLERDSARETALKTIEETSAMVQKTIARMEARKATEAKSRRKSTKWEKKTKQPGEMLNLTSSGDPDPYATLLSTQITDTSDAASLASDLDKVDGVMNAFDAALSTPNLETWSAPLETIPMLAIQPGQSGAASQIYYTKTQLDSTGKSTVDSWTLFSPMPAEPNAGETTHLFSYQGSLFATVGAGAWQLKPASTTDPNLYKAAIDDWTKAWNFPWVPIAQALPASDALSVVQYYTYTSTGELSTQGVVNLGADNSLSYAAGDITTNTSFIPMTFSPGNGVNTAPSFTKIASFDSSLWGFINTPGQAPFIYEISVNSSFSSWSIASISQMTDSTGTDFTKYSISDITAVDTGLAVALSDGNIWKMIFEPTNNNGKVITTWEEYLPIGTMNTLGAACPGLIVDMKLLITYLKTNYIQTQTNVLKTIPLLQAYIKSHEALLVQMTSYINQYNATTDPQQRATIEQEAGSDAINQANYFGNAISSNLSAINDAVVLMGRQSEDVSTSLTAQLYAINDKLSGLNATLKTDQSELDKLQAGFWASVAACLAGLVVMMVGAFTLNPAIIAVGGFMTVGGAIAIGVLGYKINQLQEKIAGLQQQIGALTSTQEALQNVLNNVNVMGCAYSGLDSFWTTMWDVSQQSLDETIYGTLVVKLPLSNVQGAQQSDIILSTALTDYVATLGAQGITIQDGVGPAHNFITNLTQRNLSATDVDNDTLLKNIETAHATDDERRHTVVGVSANIFDASTEKYRSGDKKAWISLMAKADSLLSQAFKKWVAPQTA